MCLLLTTLGFLFLRGVGGTLGLVCPGAGTAQKNSSLASFMFLVLRYWLAQAGD